MRKIYFLILLLLIVTTTVAQESTQETVSPPEWLIYEVLDYGTQYLDTETWFISNASEDTSQSYVQVYWEDKNSDSLVVITLKNFETTQDRDERFHYFTEEYLANYSWMSVSRCAVSDDMSRVVSMSPTMGNADILNVQVSFYEHIVDDKLRSTNFVFEETYLTDFEEIIALFFPEIENCPDVAEILEESE